MNITLIYKSETWALLVEFKIASCANQKLFNFAWFYLINKFIEDCYLTLSYCIKEISHYISSV